MTSRTHSRELLGALLAAAALAWTPAASAQPTFSKVFVPNTIGPGSVSMLTFTITNNSVTPVTDLAFTDVLPTVPGDIDIASPAVASTTCDDAVLTAPPGGGTITLSGGRLGGSSSCTVMVQVTASTLGVHTNLSGSLTSSAGNSGTATDDLTVVQSLPGFSKSFAPSTVSLGGRSTLTFLFDNSLNPSRVGNLEFTDNLPAGMVVADPPNASTNCIAASAPDTTLTAVAGTSVIALDADGSTILPGFEVLAANGTCMVTVDVIGAGSGMLENLTDELLADFTAAGKAAATLDVTVTPLSISKSFTDDPVAPGGAATLEFTIENFDRNFQATGVGFTDDLGAALSGLTYSSLISSDCGGSVGGVGTTMISFTGGTIAPEGSCTIRVSLTVPNATPGAYTNTTSAVSGTVDSSPVTGNMATETLFVEAAPVLTKAFIGNPIQAGNNVILRFTIANASTTSAATNIAFRDELTTPSLGLPFPLVVVTPALPTAVCGGTLSFFFPDTERQGLDFTGGSLAAAGMAGDSCTFDLTITVPAGFPPGTYTNTTEQITATVDGATRTGDPASDDLVVTGAPSLTKAFTNDPVAPGGTVMLELTLSHSANAAGNATSIAFTDDLSTFAGGMGLTFTGVESSDCGGSFSGVGTTMLGFSGGSLTPGQTCTILVSLGVPAGASAGSFTNTTSMVTATVGGLMVTAPTASDNLQVSGLAFTKQFLTNPVIPGQTTTLRFTIQNTHPTLDATGVGFTDSLSAVLPGTPDLTPTLPPASDDCGGTMLFGSGSLSYSGGSVMSMQTCTIDVAVIVPAGAPDGDFSNITSSLSANQGGAVAIDPAVDLLTVSSTLLQLTKEFTNDPLLPGAMGTLVFTLTNLDPTNAASSVAFTDDLNATLTGLTGAPASNTCGGGMLSGGSTLSFSGGSVAAGSSCTITATVTVPMGAAPGTYPNTSSGVTGTINGLGVTGEPAMGDLTVGALTFSKTFLSMPEAGQTVVLQFVITNNSMTDTFSDIGFSDDLDAVVSGLAVAPGGLPPTPACFGSSTVTGSSSISLVDGVLTPLGSCTINVTLAVPSGAPVGVFPNTTSSLFVGGLPTSPPATANLTITGTVTNQATITADGLVAPVMTNQTSDSIVP